VALRKHLYFRGFVAQFERIMTRRLAYFLAGLLAAGGLRADTADSALIKAAVVESNVAYLRVNEVAES